MPQCTFDEYGTAIISGLGDPLEPMGEVRKVSQHFLQRAQHYWNVFAVESVNVDDETKWGHEVVLMVILKDDDRFITYVSR